MISTEHQGKLAPEQLNNRNCMIGTLTVDTKFLQYNSLQILSVQTNISYIV